jgi:hypothetical protein
VLDKRFSGRQGNATLQRIWHGQGHDAALWCEGPAARTRPCGLRKGP